MILTSSHPRLLISDLKPVHSNLDVDSLLVLAAGLDGHLELLERVLAHPVPPGLLHLQHPDQLPLEHLAVADKLLLVPTSP